MSLSRVEAFRCQAILQQPLEDETDVGDMLFHGFREYEDVVQVDENITVDDLPRRNSSCRGETWKTAARVRKAERS